MNSKLNYKAKHSIDGSTIATELTLISFEEDSVSFVYCPALDLTGYGNTEDEAKKSFSQTLKMYFDDTTNKNTLFADLERHGWIIEKQKKLKSPDFDFLFRRNKQFKSIVNKRDFSKYNEKIQFPDCVYV